MSRRRISAAALAALAALTLVVGCSSDSSDADSAGAKTTTTAAAESDGTTETTAADDGEADTTSTTGAGGSGADLQLTGDFCEMAEQIESQGDAIFGEETTDTTPEAQLANMQNRYQTLDVMFTQLNQDPPAEIAEAVGVLAEAASSNYDLIKDMTDFEAAAEALTSAGDEDSEAVETKASEEIGTYIEEECGGSSE